MNLLQNGGCDLEEVFVRSDHTDTRGETISLRNLGYTPLGSQIKDGVFGRQPTPLEESISFSQVRPIGTNFGEVIRVRPSPTIQKDTFMDNELGEAVRSAKAKFGNAPFIEAYKKVRSTSKKIDDRRKESLKEEVRLRSILRAGED